MAAAKAGTDHTTVTEGTNFSVDAGRDARVVIDVLGSIWVVPQNGGTATAIDAGPFPAQRPQWSPSGKSIVYQVRTEAADQLWLYELDAGSARRIGGGKFFDQP